MGHPFEQASENQEKIRPQFCVFLSTREVARNEQLDFLSYHR
jgi:hypothetical protein